MKWRNCAMMKIDEIIVGKRFRREMGDIKALAESNEEQERFDKATNGAKG